MKKQNQDKVATMTHNELHDAIHLMAFKAPPVCNELHVMANHIYKLGKKHDAIVEASENLCQSIRMGVAGNRITTIEMMAESLEQALAAGRGERGDK
jgi:hypothetical protein